MLEDHADFGADFLDILDVVGQFGAIDNDPAALVLFEPVDAADQGRLPRTRRPADDNPLPGLHLRLMSLSTWNSPYHLCMLLISMIGPASGMIAVWFQFRS